MHNNGISHLKVDNDFQGVLAMLNWLSFVPSKQNESLPILEISDPVDRTVDVEIASNSQDPRILLEGEQRCSKWIPGFFDKSTFKETLAGWAKGVVVGRARLGGDLY